MLLAKVRTSQPLNISGGLANRYQPCELGGSDDSPIEGLAAG